MLIFVHIPKTGGTSLRAAMTKSLGEQPRGWTPNGSKYISLSHEDSFPLMVSRSKGCTVAAGHIPYGLHEHIDEPYEYMTVLRHPAERILSKYNMPAQPRTLSPKEFVKESARFQNLATRQLAGLGLDHKEDITEENYRCALENLRSIKYVGTTRNLEPLWSRIKSELGFSGSLVHYSSSTNPRNNHTRINSKVENIDSETIDGIIKYNEWDLKLYEEAQRLQRIL